MLFESVYRKSAIVVSNLILENKDKTEIVKFMGGITISLI